MIDDKLRILTAMKDIWRERLTTVFPRHGHYALDARKLAAYPPADLCIDCIGDLLEFDFSRRPAGVKWITRERPKIDRIAYPWLITRFIDDEPTFLYVRGADTSRLDLAPQAAGLYAVSLGLSAVIADDQQMLQHGIVIYDALYAWCKNCQSEIHGWPPD